MFFFLRNIAMAALTLVIACDANLETDHASTNTSTDDLPENSCSENQAANDVYCLWLTGFDKELPQYAAAYDSGVYDDYNLAVQEWAWFKPDDQSIVQDYITAHLLSSTINEHDLQNAANAEALRCTLSGEGDNNKLVIDEFGLEAIVPDFQKDFRDARKNYRANETWTVYTKVSFEEYDIKSQLYQIKSVDSAYSGGELLSPEGTWRHPVVTEYLTQSAHPKPSLLASLFYSQIYRGSSRFIRHHDNAVNIVVKGSLDSFVPKGGTHGPTPSLLESIQRTVFDCAKHFPKEFEDMGLTRVVSNSHHQMKAANFDFRALSLEGASDFWDRGIRLKPETARALNGSMVLQISFDHIRAGSSYDSLHTVGTIKRIMGTYRDEAGKHQYLLLFGRQVEQALDQ